MRPVPRRDAAPLSGGERIGAALDGLNVPALFTLCGGHISPILVGAKQAGVRVIDVRDEASAVFAADALARLTGGIGVAAVTAGPGVTNTITAVFKGELSCLACHDPHKGKSARLLRWGAISSVDACLNCHRK